MPSSAKMLFVLALSALNAVASWGAEIFVNDGIVHIIGPIEVGDDERFRAIVSKEIQQRPSNPVQTVRLYSPGGNLDAALKIGDQVYSLQLGSSAPERVPDGRWKCTVDKTEISFDPNAKRGDSRCVCASACVFIWAAGAIREGDVLAVHRPSFNAKDFSSLSPDQSREKYNDLLSKTRLSLQKWGIPDDVVNDIFSTDSASISFLERDTLRKLQRTPALDEQIIARCGVVVPRDKFVSQAMELWKNKRSLEDTSPASPYGKAKWNWEEHRRRTDALFNAMNCQIKVLREIHLQTNALYLSAGEVAK